MPEIGVIFGGPSPEHDVSILTGLQATRELQGAGRSVRGLFWSKAAEWFEVDPGLEASDFVNGVPTGASPLSLTLGVDGGFRTTRGLRSHRLELDAVLVCCHGGPGENGTLQAALELAGIPYSGPSVAGAALGMDKLAFAGIVEHAGLPTLPRRLLTPTTREIDFDGPYIVKPRYGGSSIGIDVVANLDAANVVADNSVHLSDGAVIEPFRPDLFDLQIAVRTWPQLELSAIERPLRSSEAGLQTEILGYKDKYSGGEGMVSAPREVPAQIPRDTDRRIREVTHELVQLAGIRGITRADYLSDGTEIYINEINTIPGSLAKYLWIAPKLPFGYLLSDLLSEAESVSVRKWTSDGADSSILRGASSIAAKLS